MKHVAALSLACALWLVHRRRRNASTATTEAAKDSLRTGNRPIPYAHHVSNGPTCPSLSAAPAPAPQTPAPAVVPSKSVLSAVLQWTFLILLGAALSLTAAKGSWDVFGLLMAAAALQLGGQLVRWLWGGVPGSNSSSGSGRRGRAAHRAAARRGGAANMPSQEVQVPARPLQPDPRLGGVWVKDPSRSDSMDEATSVMQLNGIIRTAIRLIRGLELDPEGLKAGRFDMAIFSVIAFFKVRESYLLDGTPAQYNRRDLRRGKHVASVAVQPDGSVVLNVSWGEPLAGAGTDHFVLIPEAVVASGGPGAEASPGIRGTASGVQPAPAPARPRRTATFSLSPPPSVSRDLKRPTGPPSCIEPRTSGALGDGGSRSTRTNGSSSRTRASRSWVADRAPGSDSRGRTPLGLRAC